MRDGRGSLEVMSGGGRPTVSPVTIELDPDIAFEYLDDGGLLITNLRHTEMWQLSAPAGMIWQLIWKTRDFQATARGMSERMEITPEEASEGLLAFCAEMQARDIVADVTEGGVGAAEDQPDA